MKATNVIVILAVLVIAFILITLIKGPSSKEAEVLIASRELSCIESCNGNEICMQECDTITINQAVLAKDLNKCKEIEDIESNVLCKDKVIFSLAVSEKDISKCEDIINLELKNLCNELAK